MSRSQRSRSQRSKTTTRLVKTQPEPDESFAMEEDTNANNHRFLDTDQKEDLTKKMVIYILQNSTVKTPIKRVDIIKHVLNGQAASFNELFKYAETKLKTIYGIKLVVASKPNMYLCIKAFPTKSISFLNSEGQKRFSLLFMIISYIFMKGGQITYLNLKEYLLSFEINIDSTDHSTLGNVKKLIEEFTKQLYLKKTVKTVESAADEVVEYSWGERSDLEFDKKILLDKVAGLLKKPVECFMEQYGKANDNNGDGGDESMEASQETDSDD